MEPAFCHFSSTKFCCPIVLLFLKPPFRHLGYRTCVCWTCSYWHGWSFSLTRAWLRQMLWPCFESLLQVKQCSDSTFKGSFLTNKSKRRCRVTLIGGICLSIILCVSWPRVAGDSLAGRRNMLGWHLARGLAAGFFHTASRNLTSVHSYWGVSMGVFYSCQLDLTQIVEDRLTLEPYELPQPPDCKFGSQRCQESMIFW